MTAQKRATRKTYEAAGAEEEAARDAAPEEAGAVDDGATLLLTLPVAVGVEVNVTPYD
jgi:hypothetical protein